MANEGLIFDSGTYARRRCVWLRVRRLTKFAVRSEYRSRVTIAGVVSVGDLSWIRPSD